MLKRVGLFIATNLAVMLLLSLVLGVLESVFHVESVLHVRLGNMGPLIVIAGLFGFGGSLISLLLSKWIAKRATGMHVIEKPRNETESWLVATVTRQAAAAGVKTPEIGIYDAPEINAFATGATRNSSLVAVSTGLLRAMSHEEAEAVLGHEMTHVANGDMVTMALLQGVLNTFVIVLSRVVGRVIDAAVFGNREGGGLASFLIVMVLNVVFGLLASLIVMRFSRWREFRADAGGARLAGKEKMIAALERLGLTYGQNTLPNSVQAFGISGGIAHGLRGLFMSHPPLAVRIQALRAG